MTASGLGSSSFLVTRVKPGAWQTQGQASTVTVMVLYLVMLPEKKILGRLRGRGLDHHPGFVLSLKNNELSQNIPRSCKSHEITE